MSLKESNLLREVPGTKRFPYQVTEDIMAVAAKSASLEICHGAEVLEVPKSILSCQQINGELEAFTGLFGGLS
jgi:hypothetical protein